MKRVFHMLFLSFCFGIIALLPSDTRAKGSPALNACQSSLSTCQSDLAECLSAPKLSATGQVDSFVPGDDGDVQAGAPLSFTDNGDGTITDNNTGLMWEKKTMDNTVHDVRNLYIYAPVCIYSHELCQSDSDCPVSACIPQNQACTLSFASCFVDSDCPENRCLIGGSIYEWVQSLNAENFAGDSDWRIPNIRELESIVIWDANTPAGNIPSVPAEFNSTCTEGCTLMTCSCTDLQIDNINPFAHNYWSSTERSSTKAFSLSFSNALDHINLRDMSALSHVRAVRGGL